MTVIVVRCLAMVLLGALASAGVAHAGVDVRIWAEDGTVYVDALARGLFTEELDEALRSGLPARVEVELVAYERRSALFDRSVREASWEVRVVFDLLDERYRVLGEDGERLLDAAGLSEVEEFVTAVEEWPLCLVSDLETERPHYLGVEFRIEPLSIDEVRDLERWLRGNVRDGRRLRDVPGQIVGILRNRLGLGGHSERGRSAEFVPARLGLPD